MLDRIAFADVVGELTDRPALARAETIPSAWFTEPRFHDLDSEAARLKIDEDIAFADRVQDEDIDICERVHRGLGSRGYDRGRFSVKFESGVYHFQNLVREAYSRCLTGEDVPLDPPPPLDPKHDD
jgi:hypothetical protein